MSYIVLRRPQRSHFNFFEDDFFTPTLFHSPRFAIQRRIDPFEDLFSNFERNFSKPQSQEKDFEFEMKLSERIPRENVKVQVINGNLKVEASLKEGNSFESYSKQVSIPNGFDVEKISAKLKSGKLSVSIPRIESNLIEKNVEVQIVENVEKEKEIEEKQTPLQEKAPLKEEAPIVEESNENPLIEEVEIKENEKEPLLQDSKNETKE
jgi:HSP20 family molecular chaperone IbpA